MNELPGIKEKQIWLTGTLSPRARKEIESRGWQIHDRAEAQFFSWVETYPDYKKPEERLPSGLVTLTLKSVALGVGGSSGEGTLNFQGRSYPFSISGMSLVDIGISNLYRRGESLRSEESGRSRRHLRGKPGDLCHRRRRQRHVDEK